MLLKLFIAALLGIITIVNGQVLRGDRCNTYQGSTNFTGSFITKMQLEERSYLTILSSGPSLSCQKLQFFKNDSFVYSYADAAGNERNNLGTYEATPISPLGIGTIKLTGLPLTVLQSGVNGVKMRVVAANDEQLVFVSCINIGRSSAETISGMVEETHYINSLDKNNTVKRINETVTSINFPSSEGIVEQSQICAEDRGTETLLKLYDFLVKLGIIDDSIILRALFVTFVNALGGGGIFGRTTYSASGGTSFYPAPVNYPLGGYSQQGYFVPHGSVPQQNVGSPQASVFSQAPYSQFRHPFNPQPQATQNYMYPQRLRSSIYPQIFQSGITYPQNNVGRQQVFPLHYQLPQSFVYPPVGQQSAVPVSTPSQTSSSAYDPSAQGYGINPKFNQFRSKLSQSKQQFGNSGLESQLYTNDPTFNPFVSPWFSN